MVSVFHTLPSAMVMLTAKILQMRQTV
ncbi:hypothetical protein E2C01_078127 [Portunus trituberculatus]|uniref:Uncharacterized protein n=1 Tax=Portunus trituberculatus TaxID=210409 RepID=A0A5B7IRW6_PORTR|nr:hypothetical protein [Portunus trituberculatus]